MKQSRKWHHVRVWSVLMAVSLAVAACGGGGGSAAPSTLISGTAAAGAPIIGTATIKDSSNPAQYRTAAIGADGRYAIDTAGMTAPFLLRAEGEVGGRRYSLFSAATSADVGGNVNITPLTDLIVANIAGDIAANYYNAGNFDNITQETLDSQAAALTTQLLPVLTSIGLDNSINLLRTSFNADHSGMDAVLDVLKVEIDNDTKIATIVNVINNSNLSQDLTTNLVTGALDNAGVANGVSAIQQINDSFRALSNLCATRRPTFDEIAALGLFDNTNFLSGGKNYDQFLTMLTTDVPVGITFGNITVDNTTADSMTVNFVILSNGRVNARKQWLFKRNPTTGKYQAWGDGRQVDIWLESRAIYSPDFPTTQKIYTGILLEVKDPALYLNGNGVAILTGPGGVNQTFVYDISRGSFRNTADTIGTDYLVPLTDGQIAQIPDMNAEYTITIYDNTAGQMIQKGSYTETLPKRPYLNSELTIASFPSITSVTPSTHVGFAGGTVSAAWTMPEGLQPDWFDVWMGDGGSHDVTAELFDLAPGARSGSVTFTAAQFTGWSPLYGSIQVGAEDAYGRFLSVLGTF